MLIRWCLLLCVNIMLLESDWLALVLQVLRIQQRLKLGHSLFRITDDFRFLGDAVWHVQTLAQISFACIAHDTLRYHLNLNTFAFIQLSVLNSFHRVEFNGSFGEFTLGQASHLFCPLL